MHARQLKELAGALLHWSGAGRAFELTAQPAGAIILMYHSVAPAEAAPCVHPANWMPPELFEQQMAFLGRHRRVVPLSALVEDIAAGRSPRAGTVCITFDDGYRDNLTVAAPILARHRLPATFYLATGYVERGETQWADVLHCLFRYRTRECVPAPAQRASVRRGLHRLLLEAQPAERDALLRQLEARLRPSRKPPRLTMDWSEVRELARRYPGFEFGGHTRDHVDLRGCDADTARRQIAGCAEDLRRELGAAPAHFSFPYERWSASARGFVAASGWRSAVGAGERFRVDAASDRFAMPRVETPRSMTELRFKTSGAFPGALSLLGVAPA